jgi:hypothetical protein
MTISQLKRVALALGRYDLPPAILMQEYNVRSGGYIHKLTNLMIMVSTRRADLSCRKRNLKP